MKKMESKKTKEQEVTGNGQKSKNCAQKKEEYSMDYIERIVEILKKATEDQLKIIYQFVKAMLE